LRFRLIRIVVVAMYLPSQIFDDFVLISYFNRLRLW